MIAGENPKTFFETISARRSVRAYLPGVLDREVVGKLLEAAVLAPTAMHEEPWGFVVIQDRNVLKRLSNRAKPLFIERLHRAGQSHVSETFSSPDFDLFHGAGTLVVICAKPAGPFAEADCWLAADNLMLAACANGLGTCVIGSAVAALNLPEVKMEIGIPVEYEAIAPVVVGIPAGETPATSRKPPAILAWV